MRITQNRILHLLFIILLFPAFSFAQEPEVKLTPLVTLEGRVISKHNKIYLITSEGRGYLLKEIKGLEDVFEKIKEFADRDADVTLSAIDTGETKGYIFIDRDPSQEDSRPRAKKVEYRVVSTAYFHGFQEGSKVLSTDITQPVAVEVPSPAYVELDFLRQVRGKVSKFNLRSVIPTIELEGKPDFAIIIPADAEAIKVVGGNLMTFKPRDVIKEGLIVEILYAEKENLKRARVIVLRE